MLDALFVIIIMAVMAFFRGFWSVLEIALGFVIAPFVFVYVTVSNAIENRANRKIKRLAQEIIDQGIPEKAEWIGWDCHKKEIFWGPDSERTSYNIIERFEKPKKRDWSRY